MSKKNLLFQYGRDVLESEYFTVAEQQVHHLRSTVASHSINTALVCIAICCVVNHSRNRLNQPLLITAALAHDLGMVGRDEKYSSNIESYKEHPKESVRTMKTIRPDADRRICDAIETHMYPVTTKKPASREAWALCVADKIAACTDWFCHKSLD